MNMQNKEIIKLCDENGDELEFELLDIVEYKNNEYAVLIEQEQNDPAEVTILKIEDSGVEDVESYVSVDNEAELQAIFKVFKKLYGDEYNFVD